MLRFLKRWPRLAPRVSESSTEDRAAEGERKLTSGTFCNPDTYPGVGGEALANYVKRLWAAVADFSIELLNASEIQPGLVAHHWLVRGTDVGPRADGSKGKGRTFSIKGASIIQLEGDKIILDQCYFDGRDVRWGLRPKLRLPLKQEEVASSVLPFRSRDKQAVKCHAR